MLIIFRRARIRERLKNQLGSSISFLLVIYKHLINFLTQLKSFIIFNQASRQEVEVSQELTATTATAKSSILGKYVSESESEYETDTDESSSSEEIMKPVFVPKSKRITILEMNAVEENEKKKSEIALQKREQRKLESRNLVAESIRKMSEKNELENVEVGENAGMPDDTDDLEDETEFENWKLRELGRLKRFLLYFLFVFFFNFNPLYL